MTFDKRQERGPFDIIGDVHGCAGELEELLGRLGYGVRWHDGGGTGSGDGRSVEVAAPAGRRAIFVGDLVDRGPRSADTLRIAMAMVAAGDGFCVPGNHDDKFRRWLTGNPVKVTHGLATTVAEFENACDSFAGAVEAFLDALPPYLWLDGGRLVVAHAGIREAMIGRTSKAIERFCLYGDVTGERDAYGLPVRGDWAADYRGAALVVYGHTVVEEVRRLNNTICIDTACCFGGKLTALRYPEDELVEVAAFEKRADLIRPLSPPSSQS